MQSGIPRSRNCASGNLDIQDAGEAPSPGTRDHLDDDPIILDRNTTARMICANKRSFELFVQEISPLSNDRELLFFSFFQTEILGKSGER